MLGEPAIGRYAGKAEVSQEFIDFISDLQSAREFELNDNRPFVPGSLRSWAHGGRDLFDPRDHRRYLRRGGHTDLVRHASGHARIVTDTPSGALQRQVFIRRSVRKTSNTTEIQFTDTRPHAVNEGKLPKMRADHAFI